MMSIWWKYVLTALLSVYLTRHIIFADETTSIPSQSSSSSSTAATASTATLLKKTSNRFLAHLVRKYGSHGTISFEGFEHLMHNLGIGDLELKHPLYSHRPSGYIAPEVDFGDYTVTNENGAPDVAATTATAYAVENDYNLIKLINTLDNDKQQDIFRTMHDPNHRHPRHRDSFGLLPNTCLSPIALIQMYIPDQLNNTEKTNPIYRSSVAPDNDDQQQHHHQHQHQHHHHHHQHNEIDEMDFSVSNVQITPTALLSMCPALLVQIEQGACMDAPEPLQEPSSRKQINEISTYAWIMALVSITVISMCGLIGIAIVPLTKFSAYHEILRFMIAVAVGTLVGDALMHLIPHALTPHDHSNSGARHAGHDHGNETNAVWLLGCAFFTALIMYFIESLLPLLSGNNGHGHSHGPQVSNKVQAETVQQNELQSSNCGSCEDLDNDIESSKKNNEENVMVKDTKVRPLGELTPVAFMVVIGDGLHNLTDGMAIGAAFGVDPVTGMATALAVLCHELPHELGDFALLLQTGVSLRRAFVFNFISSVLSLIGMVVGLLIVNANSELVRWIYTGTAGTFLYIAFADLLPELGRAEQSIKMTIVQALGILLGGIIMLLIGLYEDNLRILFE